MDAIRIIKDEHFAISAVLHALRHHIRAIRGGTSPDFQLLRAILDYIVSYPDHWHHPKEDRVLFVAVRRRAPEADALIGKLEREHALGYPMIETLKRQLIRFEAGEDGAAEEFFATAERYATLESAHLRAEEEELLPLAERVPTTEDWQEIDDAFRENDNPLFGLKPQEEAERLYQRILDIAPPPLGYGRPDAGT